MWQSPQPLEYCSTTVDGILSWYSNSLIASHRFNLAVSTSDQVIEYPAIRIASELTKVVVQRRKITGCLYLD